MSETFGDGRVTGFAPGEPVASLVSDEETARLVNISKNRKAGRAIAAIFLVVLGLSAIGATFMVYANHARQEAARQSYFRLATACVTGSRTEYAHRYQEFESATQLLAADDPLREDLMARHVNLILLGQCR